MDCVHTTTKICRFNRGAALRLSLYFDNSPEYRALRSIADYRASFAEQVQEVSDRIIKTEPVLQIRQSSSNASA